MIRTRLATLTGFFLLSLGAVLRAQAPACDTFPWIVTGSDVPGGGVVVNVCGLSVGCLPHNPQVTVSGNQIQIMFTAAELPDCICIPSENHFNQNVFVPSLPLGTYGVTVTLMNCGQPNVVGTGSVVAGTVAGIPALDRIGMAILVLLLSLAAFWKLRG